MGKSDPIIFSKYYEVLSTLKQKRFDRVCFLGYQGSNSFTNSIDSDFKEFHDLQLNNWNINDKNWKITEGRFDLVICTRCAYFSKAPAQFMIECHRILKPGGKILVDWGLGDHWRFKNYKIGWAKAGEHEFYYNDDNFLWSCVWHDKFMEHPEYLKFSHWAKKFGYDDVKLAIQEEVPQILNLQDISNLFSMNVDIITLWEESPQMYIIMLGEKKELD